MARHTKKPGRRLESRWTGSPPTSQLLSGARRPPRSCIPRVFMSQEGFFPSPIRWAISSMWWQSSWFKNYPFKGNWKIFIAPRFLFSPFSCPSRVETASPRRPWRHLSKFAACAQSEMLGKRNEKACYSLVRRMENSNETLKRVGWSELVAAPIYVHSRRRRGQKV